MSLAAHRIREAHMQVGRETGRQLESLNGGSPAPYHDFHMVPLPNHLVCLWQQVLARGGVARRATGMCRMCHMVQVGQVSGVHIGRQPREPVLHQFVAGGKVVRAAHHTPAVPPNNQQPKAVEGGTTNHTRTT